MKALTVIVKIKPGQADALRQVLTEVGKDIKGNPYMRFTESRKTHFARLLITDDPDNGPRVLFSSNYDGTLRDYIEELIAISPGIDAIWGKCEDYNGVEDFAWFIRGHAETNEDIFVGFPTDTVEQVRNKIVLRKQIEQFLGLDDVARYLDTPGIKPFLDLLDKIAKKPSLLKRLWAQVDGVWQSISGAIHQVALNASLQLAEVYGRIGMSTDFSRVFDNCVAPAERQRYLNQLTDLENAENTYIQNQMTVYAEIKSGLSYQIRLRLAMFLAAYVITYGWPPGEFSGVFTLHSFHWNLIDGGRRLLFMSNFDGSLQNYLGDFLDKLNWGLNVFYNNCVGYPPGGMVQVETFYQWIREHQIPPLVYYSAYPETTVLNIMRDQQISSIGTNFDREAAEQWLELL